MKNRGNLNNILRPDRKSLYIVLGIVMILVFTLTVVYAALSTTLNISGNAEITAASWDIYLDNVQLNSNSASKNLPIITTPNTASFTSTLNTPGDFYEFTIDVVNNGTIDAMIDSVTKIPELTDTQKKYLKYIVEYQNGESISTKQLVAKKSFVRLKVRIEFRNDISPSDLPTISETLNLAFTVNYVQSDDSNENVTIDNNGKLIKIISGDYDTVGSEICIKDECFYVISSDEDSVTMLAKYNLEVGNICTSPSSCTPIENPSGIQDSSMIGKPSDISFPRYGIISFSSKKYYGKVNAKTYVYNSSSILYNYIENYKTYLESQGVEIEEARLINLEELEALGCGEEDCYSAPSWVYATSYWSGVAASFGDYVIAIDLDGDFFTLYNNADAMGCRPVIVIPKAPFL